MTIWNGRGDLHREVVEIAIAEILRENDTDPDSAECRALADLLRQEGNIPRLVARIALDSAGQLRDAYYETLDALGLNDGNDTLIEIPPGWTRHADVTIDTMEDPTIARWILDHLDAWSTRNAAREPIDGVDA